MKLFKKLSKDVKKYQKDVDTMTADLDQVNMTARWGVTLSLQCVLTAHLDLTAV